MPSLWKKVKGNNRISRLVADLQTPPKRGGSLVVESRFPTSLVDLFVKNRDKLKKPKTKKHNSNKLTTISEDDDSDYQKRSLNHPRASLDYKVNNFEENIINNDLSVEKPVAHQKPVVEIKHDCGENEDGTKKYVEGSNSKNSMVLLSVLMGVLSFVVALYAKNWLLTLITLGIILLLLLKYLGNGVSKWVLKGGLIVIVALYTRWLVVVITIGASLLILGNSILGFFNPCEDAKGKLQGILPHWGDSNKQWSKEEFDERRLQEGREILTREVHIHNDGVNVLVSRRDFDQELVVNEAISRKEIKPQCGNCLILKNNDNSSSIEEEKSIVQPLAPESNDSNYPKGSDFGDSIGYIDLQRVKVVNVRREGLEDDKLLNHYGKGKKEKKFWKKLVHKKRKSKRKKHEHGGEITDLQSEINQDNSTDLGEEDDEDESEISEEGLSRSTSRSGSTLSLNEDNEVVIDKFELANICITEMLQLDNRNTKPCGMVKEGYGNMKYLTAMAIPLTGLIGGRILAVFVTVICCLMLKFKMA